MRINLFGYNLEITIGRKTKNDDVIWNPSHRCVSRLGDLTPTELRAELARVYFLASNDCWYWIGRTDPNQRLYEINSLNEHKAYQEIESRRLGRRPNRECPDTPVKCGGGGSTFVNKGVGGYGGTTGELPIKCGEGGNSSFSPHGARSNLHSYVSNGGTTEGLPIKCGEGWYAVGSPTK